VRTLPFAYKLVPSTLLFRALFQVEPIRPPVGAVPGQLISFSGHKSEIAEPGNRATKAFTKVADDLFVDDGGLATYKGVPFMTPSGPCTSSLKGKIS